MRACRGTAAEIARLVQVQNQQSGSQLSALPAEAAPIISAPWFAKNPVPDNAKDAALSSRAPGISSLTLMETLYYCLGNVAESLDR
jgi:hypothetical protein